MKDVIEIRPLDDDAAQVWKMVVRLAHHFGDAQKSWCLVGGMMVQLHAFEHGASPRPTRDIDLLADARKERGARRAGEILDGLGATLMPPPSTSPALGYRFEIEGQIVDLLAPEGLKTPAIVLGNRQSIGIPGGTQALKRSEGIRVRLDQEKPATIRRPSLLGAILLKARALTAHRRPDDQREDLILLLSFVEDPRSMREELVGKEASWLRRAHEKLDFDSPAVLARFPATAISNARTALELLIGPSR